MRTIVTSFLLLAVAPVIALAQTASAPPSAANIVRLHPGAWQPPGVLRAAMRFEPEAGEPTVVEGVTHTLALSPSQATARARAAASVTRRADGSRHAVLGGAFMSWTVATIDNEGRLTQDCVSTEAEAKTRVDAAAQKQVRK
jgi:hypothetical protein